MPEFRIKVESDLVDLSYLRKTLKFGEVEQKAVIVSFQLKQLASPENARDIVDIVKQFVKSFAKPSNEELVVLSGRAPIWLYLMIAHELEHTVPALAVFDPKLGIIVVAVHNYYIRAEVGAVAAIDEELKAQLTQ